jgi:predicted O-linked N-acetylglucosamine transferase (SPINDLY family)
VLWLLAAAPETNDRMRQLAQGKGIDPARLVFADKRANPDHLARYPLADLFLDTFPYGAHTTASDAMWMGVPILTIAGRSFPTRVCGSLVRAGGMPDLLCDSPEQYVARAIDCGRNPTTLQPLRQRLADLRGSSLLFDTPSLIRDLEALYARMWQEYQSGALPRRDLANLEVYHEIGCELDLEQIEKLSDPDYLALYRQRLADRDTVFPIPSDNRLWKPTA